MTKIERYIAKDGTSFITAETCFEYELEHFSEKYNGYKIFDNLVILDSDNLSGISAVKIISKNKAYVEGYEICSDGIGEPIGYDIEDAKTVKLLKELLEEEILESVED